MGRVILERLQVIIEESPNVEKTRKHDDALFMMFVDLKKAYDSVPRKALWIVLEKCRVLPTMLSIIHWCLEKIQAGVRVGSTITNSFEVQVGLRQGYTMPPTLFNIYLMQC